MLSTSCMSCLSQQSADITKCGLPGSGSSRASLQTSPTPRRIIFVRITTSWFLWRHAELSYKKAKRAILSQLKILKIVLFVYVSVWGCVCVLRWWRPKHLDLELNCMHSFLGKIVRSSYLFGGNWFIRFTMVTTLNIYKTITKLSQKERIQNKQKYLL